MAEANSEIDCGKNYVWSILLLIIFPIFFLSITFVATADTEAVLIPVIKEASRT